MSKVKRQYTLPAYENQGVSERMLYFTLQRKGYIETTEDGHIVMTEVPIPIDPIARETLKRLGAPPCGFKVEKDEPVPEHIIAYWRDRGIEVEPTGVIRVRFWSSKREYIYPYRIKGGV